MGVDRLVQDLKEKETGNLNRGRRVPRSSYTPHHSTPPKPKPETKPVSGTYSMKSSSIPDNKIYVNTSNLNPSSKKPSMFSKIKRLLGLKK